MLSRKNPSQFISFTEMAAGYVCLLVTVRRHKGAKAKPAVADVAGELGLTPGRAQRLFYGYFGEIAPVDESEWMEMRERAAAMLLREAAGLRRKADYYEWKAKELRADRASRWNGGGEEAAWQSASASGGGG